MSVYAYAGLAGFQVVSGLQQAEMIRMNANLAEKQAQINAHFAELDAYHAMQSGEEQVARYDTEIDQTVSDQRSGYAAQNVDVNFGTAAEVQAEARLTGFLNKIDLKNQAAAKALGYKRESRSIMMNAASQRSQAAMNASSVLRSSLIGAATTGISGWNRYAGPGGSSAPKGGMTNDDILAGE